MEALAISAANLDAIEDNIGAVAEELSGVIANVSNVNNHVSEVDEKVSTLNNRVKDLISEIQENTTITNARQSIMYNNSLIEKKYGYFDNVRRNTISILDVIENSNISLDAINDLKENLLLNNPNYWLANALAALNNWILDDKENCDNEVKNAIRKDEEKTSIFFCLVNLKLGRINSSINWLERYLSLQNPLALNSDFVTVLDLIATGSFGDNAKKVVFNKISKWHEQLNSELILRDNEIKIWKEYIFSNGSYDGRFSHLAGITDYGHIINNNLKIVSSYKEVLDKFKKINLTNYSNKNVDNIIEDLIYKYEEKENVYQKENLKNKLIIECNGDRDKAQKLYEKISSTADDKVDLLTLLTNITINNEYYNISSETRKLALNLSKQYILAAFKEINDTININTFDINYNGYKISTKDGHNIEEAKERLQTYLNDTFNSDDKLLTVSLLIANIVGIIGICLTINNKLLNILLIIVVILSNIIILYKLFDRNRVREIAKRKAKEENLRLIESDFAECLDYYNYIMENSRYYNELEVYLNNINVNDYIKTNDERNIRIGE